MDGLQLGHQLGLQLAGLLGVQVAHLLGNVNEGGNGLVVALLSSLLVGAAGSADLHRQLLASGVSHKLARLLLHILGGAGGLIHGPALLRALAVAHLLDRAVALPHSLVEGLLLEGDLTLLLKVLLAHLLLGRGELGDIGVVALLHVLVRALKDRILLQGGDLLQLIYAAEPGVRVRHTVAKVHTARDCDTVCLTSSTGQLTAETASSLTKEICSHAAHQQTHRYKGLKKKVMYCIDIMKDFQ